MKSAYLAGCIRGAFAADFKKETAVSQLPGGIFSLPAYCCILRLLVLESINLEKILMKPFVLFLLVFFSVAAVSVAQNKNSAAAARLYALFDAEWQWNLEQ